MAANQKCERFADALVNQLTMRSNAINAIAVSKAYASGDIVLTITGSTTKDLNNNNATTLATKALVRIKPVAGLYGGQDSETNGLGGIQAVYNPLVAQVLVNVDQLTLGASVAAITATKGYEAVVISEVLKLGMNTEIHGVTKVSPGAMVVGDFGTILYTVIPDAQYPYAGQ